MKWKEKLTPNWDKKCPEKCRQSHLCETGALFNQTQRHLNLRSQPKLRDWNIRSILKLNETRQAMYIQRNTEAHLCNQCCSGRAMSIAYSVCAFVAFCIQHAPYCHLWPALLYRIVLYHLKNGKIFEKKKVYWIRNVYFDFSTILFETFLILRRIQRDIIINVRRSSCNVPIILVMV